MRKIELKNDGLSYRDLIKSLFSNPSDGQKGLRLSEIREAIKIMDKVDAADDSVLLEESEWISLRDRVEAAPYTVADKRILAFADHIIGATMVSVKESNNG